MQALYDRGWMQGLQLQTIEHATYWIHTKRHEQGKIKRLQKRKK